METNVFLVTFVGRTTLNQVTYNIMSKVFMKVSSKIKQVELLQKESLAIYVRKRLGGNVSWKSTSKWFTKVSRKNARCVTDHSAIKGISENMPRNHTL